MRQQKTTAEQRWVLGLTSIGSVMVALDVLVVAVALTTIRQDLGASIEQLEWTVNAYSLSFAVLLLTAAALGDRWGRRRTFAAGLVLFTVASVGCALATSVPLLIGARALQGVGAAVVMPLAMSLLGAAFPPERRGWAIGIFSGVTGLAVLGGPMVGGAVTEGLAWQWIFWINVPVGLLAVPLVLSRVRESKGAVRRLDPVGAGLATLAVLGPVWGVVRGEAAGWGSAEVLGSLTAGALVLLGFLAWEARTEQPMIPLGFFRTAAFSAGNAAGFFLSAALLGAVFFLSQFMQVQLSSGPLEAGLQLLPWTATLFLVAPVAGRLVDRFGERPFVVTGLLLQGAGLAWIALIAAPDIRYAELVLPLVVAGLRGVDGDARRAECGRRLLAQGVGRYGVRHLRHAAPARWSGRGRRGRSRLRGGGRLPVLQRRLHPCDGRLRRTVGGRSVRRAGDHRAAPDE
ncbi:major facilitator superfamily MFS_1 [Kribbella flavida DSM 17836]|uniref:Major facilitator superfamily MFS_1 n=1 Tax=Kribbella flavida (strain DSM 17836 / JCM 10339 / NBRC 14399) TaxID=479435 RepID=D2PVZ0_KRIFD|nr:DHA2 family efflux MFS transporter permease subunit [Kribbella flavida]ADB29647.1 major facilitator superfamily MFS_1 [Kribbella flavida DSM 17836]